MATADETLRATLSETEYRALSTLAGTTTELSGRAIANLLAVSPTTANGALRTLAEAGFASSRTSGRSTLWRIAVSNPAISDWLKESNHPDDGSTSGSSPYSTGGGGVRLEHSYAACLIASFLADEALPELGDSATLEAVRLQASDLSDADDIVLEGRDANGEICRTSIAVRRSPALTSSDDASVPLIRDFLAIVINRWADVAAGRWRLVLAVSTNANAVTQLSELAELARSLPSGEELQRRLAQPGRTNAGVRERFKHFTALVKRARDSDSETGPANVDELAWRVLSALHVRSLRLERTDRVDRTAAVNALQRALTNGTPAAADALFSRIEELVGGWAPQAAVLTQAMLRRALSNYPLARSTRHAAAWSALDRLSQRLRDSVRPALQSSARSLELERSDERLRLVREIKAVSISHALVVTGDPDVGKSALSLRAIETLRAEGAAVGSMSLRDLPGTVSELDSQLGGYSIRDVLETGEVRPLRLLLIDGAESVLEGKGDVFREVATGALRAGIAVVAVTRSDGARQVTDDLTRARELAGLDGVVRQFSVSPLTPDEQTALTDAFSDLARLGTDERSRWLLSRPGLIDALLRTDAPLDPNNLLCEADVFSVVWQKLIRRNEVHKPDAASPDDREQTALAVARRTLTLSAEAVGGTAAAELRSVGVLRTPNNWALTVGDEFATDLFRDFGLCRLFITQGWAPLVTAGAPRWSIRSVRLGCQAALLGSRRLEAWAALSAAFGQIADEHGGRWSEVPYEALLTIGNAEAALRDLWPALAAEQNAGLATLLRLAELRYVNGTIGDPFALAPIVRVVFCERPALDEGRRVAHGTIYDALQRVVLAWLRGVALHQTELNPLRQEVRDVLLSSAAPWHDEFTIEALATLGEDTDERVETRLRALASEHPSHLHSAVESFSTSISLARTKPELLIELAEAYYIEHVDPDDEWSGGGRLDDGIRDFQHGIGIGFGAPGAAWYYGPFFRLLCATPVDATAFINRMLDHAARFRVDRHTRSGRSSSDSNDLEGVSVTVPGIGERRYVGDSHVWSWYRGSSVGPYSCMSALLALERFADQLLENARVPAGRIVELLLRDCHNVAVPGMLVGFLTRHPEEANDLLDPFFASPEVWHFETSRVVGEHFSVRDPDADKLTGSDRRRQTPHQTVGAMVVNARLRSDEKRLATLEEVGARLLGNAKMSRKGAADDAEYVAMIEGWAAEFKFANYSASESPDGVLIEFERPAEIERVLAPGNRDLQRVNVLYGLQNRYGPFNEDPSKWDIEQLVADLDVARKLAEDDEVPRGFSRPADALVSVAAAAVRAHAMGLAAFSPLRLRWAVEAVMWAATNPQVDEMDFSGSMFLMGADRVAAVAAPLLLLSPFDHLMLDRVQVEQCLTALATSLFDEVRAVFANGCELVWAAPCEIDHQTGGCLRHEAAWRAATTGLIDCRMGPWDERTQRRAPDPLPRSMPYSDSLPAIPDGDLLVNRLRMPVMCMVDARHVSCIHDDLVALWLPLWDAHLRGLVIWWGNGFDHHAQITHEPIARRMIQIALENDRETVRSHIDALSADANSLHLLFDGFATVFTYDSNLRQQLRDFWPWALGVALDSIGDAAGLRAERHWFDYAVAALLPTPTPRSSDSDVAGTLGRARLNWLDPAELSGLTDRWLRLARREPKAVDAIIKYARGAAIDWQTSVGFSWIETVIDGRFDLMANRLLYVEEWFAGLRDRGVIVGDVEDHYHRIVDGLAAAGDRAAVSLQQLDE